MRGISLLGSTGSIGTQTLEVVAAAPDRFRVVALAARSSWELLAEQARLYKPSLVALADATHLAPLREALPGFRVEAGPEAIREVAAHPEADMVLSSFVGMAGLLPTLAALESGKSVALANKEALVVGGSLVMDAARRHGVPILPVDSEHSAVFQCLQGAARESVARIVLTASGGPFRTWERARLESVTAAQALKHPTWNMGAKITIDSSTLMNKGFEVLEAHHLFGLSLDQVDVWVHPQSVIHSLVEFVDGSVLAQLGPPDMRTPIQIALFHPERVAPAWSRLTLEHCRELTFETPRWEDFPCLTLAFEAGRAGGSLPAVLNAANEVAVQRFLDGEIGYLDIPRTIEAAMRRHTLIPRPTVEDLVEADRWAREQAAGVRSSIA